MNKIRLWYLKRVWWPIADVYINWRGNRSTEKLYRALLATGMSHENAVRTLINVMYRTIDEYKEKEEQ